jgi:hemolysin activation/secretion protein
MNKTLLALFSCFLGSQLALSSTANADTEELRIEVEHYKVVGESHLSESELAHLLQPYTGTNKSIDNLQQAAMALQNKLRELGYGFYQVDLAAQTLDSKEITLTIESIVIHDINVEQRDADKHYFSQQNILNTIPSLQAGTSPNLHNISSELEIANLNPAKNATVQFAMSPQANQIDADIIVSEQDPQEIYGWLNNTGSKDTGDYRLGVGYTNHNMFDKDHELRLTFTTSPDHAKDVQQYGIDYRIPFYEYRGIWQLYAYYSDVDSGTVAGGFDVAGKGTFIGTKYEWYLPKLNNNSKYGHHLVFGLEDKLFNNDVFFAKSALGTDVRSTPLSIAYHGQWNELSHNLGFYLKYEHSLVAIIPIWPMP